MVFTKRSISMRLCVLSILLCLGVLISGVTAWTSPDSDPDLGLLKVIDPNGGERWEAGTSQTILWLSHTDLPDNMNVKIVLRKGSGVPEAPAVLTIATSVRASQGSFTWAIPYDLTPGNDYWIELISTPRVADGYGNSDNFFSITPPSKTLTLIDPKNGHVWAMGREQMVRWSQTGLAGKTIDIELYKGPQGAGTIVKKIASSVPATQGSYGWTPPMTMEPGTDYWILIYANGISPLLHKRLDGYLTIPGGFAITSPAGGTIWQAGTQQSVTWDYAGLEDTNVKIELIKGQKYSGPLACVLTEGVYTDQRMYTRTIPESLTPGSDYWIKITSLTYPSVWIGSPGWLTVTAPVAKSLTVTNPMNSIDSVWEAGTSQTITWNQIGLTGTNVKIDLYSSHFGYVQTIASSVSATQGWYSWTVPSSLEPDGYEIKVTSITDYLVSDFGEVAITGPAVGSLDISSSPSGASIYFDGSYVDTTPYHIPSVPPGTYTLRLTKSGYEDYTQSVTVNPNENGQISVSLSPIVVAKGTLSLTSEPSGASVSMDGTYRGTTPLTIPDVVPDLHTVVFTLPGYQDHSENIMVQTGESKSYHAELNPEVQTQTTGTLSLTSTPAGAYVSVDGVQRGVTPLTISDASAGAHNIVFWHAGYETYSVRVNVAAGDTTTHTASLVASGQVTSTPTPTPHEDVTVLPTTTPVQPGFIWPGALIALAAAGVLIRLRKK